MAERSTLPSGSVRIRWRNRGDRRKQSLTVPASTPKREIDNLVRKIEHAVATTGVYQPTAVSPHTLPDLLETYRATRSRPTAAKRAARPNTDRIYRTVLGQLITHLQGRRTLPPSVSALTRDSVRSWLDDLAAAGRSGTTIKTYASTVRAFWAWGHETFPADVPPVDMPAVRAPRPKIVVAPSWAQLDAAIAELTDRARGVRRAMLLARWTGLRIGQAASVTWTELTDDWEGLGPALNVRVAKTEAEEELDRWIPIADGLWSLFERWRTPDPPDDQPIVGPGFPRDPHDTMNEAFERAGVPERFWRRQGTHCARRRVNTHLAIRLADIPRRYFLGRSEPTVEGRHYIDPRELFPVMRAAVETIPPLPDDLAAKAV